LGFGEVLGDFFKKEPVSKSQFQTNVSSTTKTRQIILNLTGFLSISSG
jgi:hypothetical protein